MLTWVQVQVLLARLALANPKWNGWRLILTKMLSKLHQKILLNIPINQIWNFSWELVGSYWKFQRGIDLAVANPPYIPHKTYLDLPKEVKNFEPKHALLGGEDGLDHIKEIVRYAPLYLKEKGFLLIENHFDQGTRVKQIFV